MKKLYKRLVYLCALICIILGSYWTYYLLKTEPTYQFNQEYTGRVIDIEQDLTKYHCLELNRLSGGKLKFCTLKQKMDATTTPRIMGKYDRLTDTIRLDKDSPNDRIIHEIFHSVSTTDKDEELKAQEMQSLYLQLVDFKIIT